MNQIKVSKNSWNHHKALCLGLWVVQKEEDKLLSRERGQLDQVRGVGFCSWSCSGGGDRGQKFRASVQASFSPLDHVTEMIYSHTKWCLSSACFIGLWQKLDRLICVKKCLKLCLMYIKCHTFLVTMLLFYCCCYYEMTILSCSNFVNEMI